MYYKTHKEPRIGVISQLDTKVQRKEEQIVVLKEKMQRREEERRSDVYPAAYTGVEGRYPRARAHKQKSFHCVDDTDDS